MFPVLRAFARANGSVPHNHTASPGLVMIPGKRQRLAGFHALMAAPLRLFLPSPLPRANFSDLL